MSWIKIDDGFPDHPKFLEAGPLGGFLCLCAIAWSNRNRTDGFVPRGQVRRLVDFEGFAHHMWAGELVGGGDDVDAMQLAEELVTVGLWEHVKGGFLIHDYLDWQRSREEIEALTEQRREAGKRGGRARSASASSSKSLSVSPSNSASKPLSESSSNSASKTEAEVRRKKEEEETPPQPPASGGRKRDKERFAEQMTAWAQAALPDLPSDVVMGAVSALRGARVSEDQITPERIRARALRAHPNLTEEAAA